MADLGRLSLVPKGCANATPTPDRRKSALLTRGGRVVRERIQLITLYGLVDDRLPAGRPRGNLIGLYGNRAAAERALRCVLRDEPTWAPFVRIAEFPLVEVPAIQPSMN
jgi:hypothetical protein